MNNYKFKPWVGNRYEAGIDGRKVMVLGESHYCADPADAIPEITQNVIKLVKNKKETYKAYTSFERVLLGKADVSDREADSLWDSLMFYNYVQYPMPTPTASPSSAQFREAEAPFLKVINDYSPDKIIVWGNPLYKWLPREGQQGPMLTVGGEQLETWVYTLTNGKEVRVMYMHHPSKPGFIWREWHERVRSFTSS